MTRRVALVSARATGALDEDLAPLLAAFAAAGAEPLRADWDDPEVEWSRFELALLRSTWDYTERLPEFLAWLGRAAAATRVVNAPEVVRWNYDKHYLRELQAAGAPVVPGSFAEPGMEAAAVLDEFLARERSNELVVKPAIGAGSRDARRHARAARTAALAHMRELLGRGRSVLLQPYLEAVDAQGETALIFIAGRYSHAIRKGPLLPRGAAATAALFAPEEISARGAQHDEIAAAQRVLQALPFGTLPYARVDLVRDAAQQPLLLELELIEPSLFFAHAAGSAARLATAVLAAR